MIKATWLRWVTPAVVVLTAGAAVWTIAGSSNSAESASRLLRFVGISLGVAAALSAFFLPPVVRRAQLRRQLPGAIVATVRRTAGLGDAIGAKIGVRPTLVANKKELALFGGFIRPVERWSLPWREIRQIGFGTAREYYLSLDSLVVTTKSDVGIPLPLDEGYRAMSLDQLRAIAAQIGDVGGVPVDKSDPSA